MSDYESLEERLRVVELAVVELGVLAKYEKWGVLILGAGLGIDVSGVV